MNKKLITNPETFISDIKSKKSLVYLLNPGNYTISEHLLINHKCMITAKDVNNPPVLHVKNTNNRPVFQVIKDECVISNLIIKDPSLKQIIFRLDANNVKILKNDMIGSKIGIVSGGDDNILHKNLIDGFSQDGIQFSGNRTRITHNLIQNLIQKDAEDKSHHDAIQAWAGDPNSVLNSVDRYKAMYSLSDAVIHNNIIISTTDLEREQQGALQGITAFDGWMAGWSIKNNFINTHSTIHAITILGAISSDINKFEIIENEIYKQGNINDIDPQIYIKPARFLKDKSGWTNVKNKSYNKYINAIVDYNVIENNNTCTVNLLF